MEKFIRLAKKWHKKNRKNSDINAINFTAGLLAAYWEATGKICKTPRTARRRFGL